MIIKRGNWPTKHWKYESRISGVVEEIPDSGNVEVASVQETVAVQRSLVKAHLT